MRHLKTHGSVALATLALCVVFSGADCASAQVVLKTLDGAPQEGRLLEIKPKGIRLQIGEQTETVDPARAVSLTFERRPAKDPSAKSGLVRIDIAGGDRLFGEIVDSDDDGLRLATRACGTIRISYDNLARVVVLANLRGRDAQVPIDTDAERDRLYIESRVAIDRVVGDLSRFQKDAVYFEWNEQGESRFDFKKEKVIAVTLSDVEAPESPKGIRAVAWFQDGSRLTGTIDYSAGPGLKLGLTDETSVTVRTEELQQLSFLGGDFVYLSDLEASAVVETPYIEGGLRYGLQKDRGLGGGRLVVARTFFPKGLSVHSRCELSYVVPKGFDRFSTSYGMDEAVAKRSVRGAVAFSIAIDGQIVEAPKIKRAGEVPGAWSSIEVKPGQKLTLRADFADRAHFNGWAVWGAPMFSRKR